MSKLLKDVGDVTMHVGMQSMMNRDEAGAAATDYLRLIGHLTYGFFWLWISKTALDKLDAGTVRKPSRSQADHRAFFLPSCSRKCTACWSPLKAGAKPLMELDEAHFAF